jgi:hypothetical protein
MSRLYKDDIGVNIVVATGNLTIPITAVLTLNIVKPSGATAVWAITLDMTNYTTGVLTYTTIDGDLNETGEYSVQVSGVFEDAVEFSDIDTFTVYERLEI